MRSLRWWCPRRSRLCSSCRNAARSASSISARRSCARRCGRCSIRWRSRTSRSRARTSLSSSSTGRSSRPWQHRRRSRSSFRRYSPAARSLQREPAMTATKPSGAIGAHNAKVMNRFQLTKRLVGQLKHEEAVIGGIGNANFDLWASGQRPQNFYMLGSMGLAIPIAFGVAIAQPHRHVFALEGDGSLLMQLGCLATVGERAPKNLTVVAWDNGIYQITGSQPTASPAADLVAIARGAGITNSAWAVDETDFDRLVTTALKGEGPNLIAVRIDDKPAVATTDRDPVQIRERFMRGLGVKAASA